MLDRCDQTQESAPLALLSALLAHPGFQQGVHDCQEFYFDFYGEAPLTEEEMMEEVVTNLSRRTAKADQQLVAMLGGKAPIYLEKLGWVIGTIAKGLSYIDAQDGEDRPGFECENRREKRKE